ncbi:MAG: TA system VapC family ribonuclease toxin [Bryobacteraceae bacterium]|jgi:toxin-antitoxin system PIN domain toxin
MILFFPDLNVWLALSVGGHRHTAEAWNWLNLLPREARLIFSRYTQLGLLRLLTNESAMGEQTLTLRKAWGVYDRWLNDPRVEFYPEPRGLDAGFRQATAPFAGKAAPKWVGDCFLLAYANESHATLVTFDKALLALARKQGCSGVIPG